ncbi:hypothetical protein PIROE2DRAFT_18002 [Piromyces sp. E2]|nr:hypothetical protein PIROE2DRAFT_18002 [Piromyces sp. E2]|eukprot:OUM57109.1 hypothetical protein PIROE2DRAFT_18002 [Piromyces sp. E2]
MEFKIKLFVLNNLNSKIKKNVLVFISLFMTFVVLKCKINKDDNQYSDSFKVTKSVLALMSLIFNSL